MKYLLCLFLGISVSSWAQSEEPLEIGKRYTIHSPILNEDRMLNIYLPPSVFVTDTVIFHDVIYLLDGSYDEDFLHVAGLVQFSTFHWINDLRPTIVVGIENVDRKRDFTFPTTIEKDKTDFPTTGHSAAFIQALQNEIIPFVEAEFAVTPYRTLIGQSLGGLMAAQILDEQPNLFSEYIIVSPSLWWNNESLLAPPHFEAYKSAKLQPIVSIAVGKEGKVMEGDAKKLYKLLSSSTQIKSTIHFRYYPWASHANVLHQAVYDVFRKESN